MEIQISLKIDGYLVEKMLKEVFEDLMRSGYWGGRTEPFHKVPMPTLGRKLRTVPPGFTKRMNELFGKFMEDADSPADRELKVWPDLFDVMASGEKPFDLRVEDGEPFAPGQVIQFREWNPDREPSTEDVDGRADARKYTGRKFKARVTYVLRKGDFAAPYDKVFPEGHAILGLKVILPWKIEL